MLFYDKKWLATAQTKSFHSIHLILLSSIKGEVEIKYEVLVQKRKSAETFLDLFVAKKYRERAIKRLAVLLIAAYLSVSFDHFFVFLYRSSYDNKSTAISHHFLRKGDTR